MTRRSLTVTQLKSLFARCRNMCAMHDLEPNCNGFELVQNDMFVGEIAHIAAAEEGGKRYDVDMTDDERNGNANLMILCPNHHTLIDRDETTYTTERLIGIKQAHEAGAGSEFEPTAGALQEAASQINHGIIASNVNSGDGSQNNTANANTGYSTTFNLNGDGNHYMFTVTPSASALPPLISSPLPPATGPTQTLSLSVEARVVELPLTGQPEQMVDTFCYCFIFNDRQFVTEQGVLAGVVGLAARDRMGRRFSITGAGVALLLRQARVYADGCIGTDTLYDEIKLCARDASLGVIVEECTDGNIMAIPFDRLTAADFGAANYIGFALRQGVSL